MKHIANTIMSPYNFMNVTNTQPDDEFNAFHRG